MNSNTNAAYSIDDQLNSARNFLNSGNIAGAEQVLNAVLQKNRSHAEALGLMASIVYRRRDRQLAKKLWKRSLAKANQPLIFLTNLHAFLKALLRDNDHAAGVKQADRKLPEWPMAQKPNTEERDMLVELASLLTTFEQTDSARRLLESVYIALPDDAKIKATIGLVQMLQGEHALALETLSAVDRAIQPKTDLTLLVRIYQCAKELNKKELMDSLVDRATNASPVYADPKFSGQTKNILIVTSAPVLHKTVTSDRDIFMKGNYPIQIADLLENDFHFSHIFAKSEISRISGSSLPDPDLIVNNVVNGEGIIDQDNLQTLSDFVDGFGVPVINHPRNVIMTTRDQTIKTIKDIPGVIIPNTILFLKENKTDIDLANEIENHFDYPLITRTLFFQEGKGMVKVDDRDSLLKVLATKTPKKFYVTKFVDSQDESGFYCKIRAAIVGDEITIVRVDYDPHWNVHGRKSDERIKFYLDNPHLLATEDRICANPDSELGPSIMHALEEIARRIPLDIFGIDFGVSKSGEMVFYESNASMNLLSSAPPEVDHPAHSQERLLSAMRRYLQNQ